ncbi:hypothetical protein HDE_02031 [Halotydeus destructor]|nr:hypothetical protein HDE_02031 [Halotydeus destructor]
MNLNYADYLPFKFDTETFAAHYEVMSSFDLKDKEDAEVMSSFNNISLNVVALYMAWFLLACLISFTIRKVVIEPFKHRMNEKSFHWHIIRIICDQYHRTYDLNSFKALETVLVVSIFYLVQYYYGNYSTELLIRPRADVIDNFEQLQASDKIPIFVKVDPIMSYLNQSGDKAQQAVLAKLPLDANGASEYLLSQTEGVAPATIADLIRNKNGASIILSFARTSIEYFFCQQFVEDERSRNTEPNLHTSTGKFHPALFMQVASLNISAELGKRLHNGLRRSFETRLYITAIIDNFLGVILKALNMSPTREVVECLQHKVGSSNRVDVLTLIHYRMVVYFALSAILVAILSLIGEYLIIKEKRRTDRRQRRKAVWIPAHASSHFRYRFGSTYNFYR